jgi:hypothetical protein
VGFGVMMASFRIRRKKFSVRIRPDTQQPGY